jgi:carboxymethylenebutenolidase
LSIGKHFDHSLREALVAHGEGIEESHGRIPGRRQTRKRIPSDAPKPRRGVLVLHAWWGLNDFFESFAERLASQGYVALAPDLYNGTVARTVEEAKEMMGRASDDSSKSIVLGAVDYLRSLPTVGARRIGAIGFSMGGGWALWLSVQKPEDVAAVVVFYSTGGDDYSKARAAFLGHFAADDELGAERRGSSLRVAASSVRERDRVSLLSKLR